MRAAGTSRITTREALATPAYFATVRFFLADVDAA